MQKKIGRKVKSGMKWFGIMRRQRGLSRYKLAKLLKKPAPSIDYLEKTGTKIEIKMLVDLLGILGVSWVEFGEIVEREARARKRR